MAKEIDEKFTEVLEKLPPGWVAFELDYYNAQGRGWCGDVGKGETRLFRVFHESGYWVEAFVDGRRTTGEALPLPERWRGQEGGLTAEQVAQLIVDSHPYRPPQRWV